MGTYDFEHRTVDCYYNNGVSFHSESGFEDFGESYYFPNTDFSFQEILNYYIGNGYFDIMLDLKPELFEENKYSDDEYEVFFKENEYFELSEPGSWGGIRKENDRIVFYEGGDA